MGGSPGLVVTGGDSCSKGGGFESRHHILDGHDIFFILICCKNCIVCLKRPKINEKEKLYPSGVASSQILMCDKDRMET